MLQRSQCQAAMSSSFRVPMTEEQRREEARIATEEGMRELATATAAAAAAAATAADDDDDDEYFSSSSSDSSEGRGRGRKRGHSGRSAAAATEKLESRIRYLQLDLANAKVETQDAVADVGRVKDRLEPYIKANNELAYIGSAIDRSTKGLDDLTIKQFKHKMDLFISEVNEHIGLCAVAVGKIDLHQVKAGLERLIAAERRRAGKRTSELQTWLWWRQRGEEAAYAALLLLGLVLLYWLLCYCLSAYF